MDRAAVIETLNDLIESCKDGELGFQTCAEHARSDTLKELFLRRAAGCRDGADQLQKEVGRLGGNQGAARPLRGTRLTFQPFQEHSMRKPTALRHSAAAVAALLAVSVSADAVAYNRTPAPTGAPPASTTAPTAPSTGMPAGPGSAAAVPANERNFVTMAASSGMLEVDASRLALERSKDPQVRTFAQRMVDDHSKANAELKMVAKKAGLADVPSTMTSTHNGHLERLRALSGQSFDREYAAQVGVAAHTEAVALFDKASRDLVNPDIRAFAGATVPKLQEHLKQSQSLARSVGVSDDRMKAAGAPPDAATSSTMGTTGTTGSDTTSRTTGSGAGSTMGSSGTTGGSTSDRTTGTSGTGTSGGTGTGAPKSSTGK